MKQSSKERLATLLMDELLERFSARESIRKMLGDMTSLPIDEVIEDLLVEFEHAVEEYHNQYCRAPKQLPDKVLSIQAESIAEVVPSPEPVAPQIVPEEQISELSDESSSLLSALETTKDMKDPVLPTVSPGVAGPVAAPETALQVQPSNGSDQSVSTEPAFRGSFRDSKPEKAETHVQFDPIKLEFPKIRLKVDLPLTPEDRVPDVAALAKSAPQPVEKKEADVATELPDPGKELRRLEELANKIEREYAARVKSETQAQHESPLPIDQQAIGSPAASASRPTENVGAGLISDEEDEITSVEPVGSGRHIAHARYAFADDDFVYVHAVSRIPENEEPSPDPFMLEEKGIDGRGFAFALDYEGMRFYLSKINPHEMSISKAMVLLLNKQESLQLQGVHESTLNDLRGHGILLPLEFGTVARGKDQFFDIVDKNRDDLEDALDEIIRTTSWTVTASVLDSTIAGIVGTDVHTVGRDRSRDRASYTSAPQLKKFDVKVLERILQREKKIAEAVHAELSAVARRSNIETIVGLGSGSSEDWKVILKASYDVTKRDIGKFNRAVTDLQYHHLQYDLMLSLTGDRDFLTLRRK